MYRIAVNADSRPTAPVHFVVAIASFLLDRDNGTMSTR